MPEPMLRILLVEDNPGDARLLQETLRDESTVRSDLIWVERLASGLACLREQTFDVLLLDLSLPDSRGLDTVSRAHGDAPHVPIIVLTGTDDEATGVEAVRRGAQDYLVKGQVDGRLLLRAIRYATQRYQVEEALRRSQQETQAANQTLEQRVAERTAEAQQRASQLQQLAVQLTQAEQRERQRLAAVLHDHLQQLLVGAKFNVGILRGQLHGREQRQTLLQLDELLDESLASSRSLTAELSPPILHEGNLSQVLCWLARWSKDKHGLSVQVCADEGVDPQAQEVRILLFQAVRELLLNTVKHARTDHARITLCRCGADQVQVLVEDDGVGFDPISRREEKIRRQSGGFGLFSIRERLELMGGRMEIASQPGHGVRVTLLAPCYLADGGVEATQGSLSEAAGPDSTAGSPAHVERDRTAIHVLVVDDHPVVRDGLARLLQLQPGIKVVGQAADGQDAVSLALRLQPEVILMDVSMPRLSGVEATRRIIRHLPDVKIIGLSMHVQEDVATSMVEAGAAAYLTKTTPPEVLLAKILECTAKAPAPVRPGRRP